MTSGHDELASRQPDPPDVEQLEAEASPEAAGTNYGRGVDHALGITSEADDHICARNMQPSPMGWPTFCPTMLRSRPLHVSLMS